MSNEEHLFENAIIALENKESYDKWLETETKYYNTLGVSEEVIKVIWDLAIYTVYTHNPALEYDYNSKAIPIEWIKKYIDNTLDEGNSQMLGFKAAIIKEMIEEWEKENEILVMPVSDNSTIPLDYLGERK